MEKSAANLMRVKHEESLTWANSTLAGLKESLAEQQDARAKSEEKFRLALADMEKMKAEHQKFEKKAHVEQAAILKRAQQAEEKLEAALQELFGFKHHISNMIQAIFGPRAATLQNDCILKLKAIYTFTEQLYTGGMMTMKAVMGNREPIKSIKHMLACLPTLPPQIEELKRPAACKGALTTLSRCLAYASELKPEEVAAGFP